jgi:integrase/recombinase XerD
MFTIWLFYMLRIYRRHIESCRYRGQRHWQCNCPIQIRGKINSEFVRESTGLTDWLEGINYANEWNSSGIRPQTGTLAPIIRFMTIEEAWDEFLLRKESAHRLQESTLYKYRSLKREMLAFFVLMGLTILRDVSLDVLERFQAGWKLAPITSFKKLERLKAFFRFCHTRGWIGVDPAAGLLPPKVPAKPTLPFSRDEMGRIFAVLSMYRYKCGRIGQENAKRLLALVLVLRYSGLRIGDAVSLSTDQIQGTKLYLSTHKTGQHVYCPLPPQVLLILNSIVRISDRYFFWTGRSKLHTVVGIWQRSLKRLFDLAGIDKGHAHRFRDTFAVELLMEGTSIEQVAVLLGHSNIKVTQKHYNPWILERQKQLESYIERVWAHDSLLPLIGTQAVRGEEPEKSNLFIIGGKGMVPAGGIEPTA